MTDIVRVPLSDGNYIEYIDDLIGSGAMKDVYFTPCKTKVVAFYREPQDAAARERLEMITGIYRERIFDVPGGEYWKELFCWPDQIIEFQGKLGLVMPVYPGHFFFEHGSVNDDMLGIKGKEKQGKWYASANNQNRFLDPRERGSWLNYLQISLKIARTVRRMHAAGLAHSDLSYKNVLVAPTRAQTCVIDVDGLVVPGKYPPDVVGTPDFIAPECVATAHLDKNDSARKLPSIQTDRHALAVLIYHYLLLRHPLRGDKVHALEPHEDETLGMGEKALFIEHPVDTGNRIKLENVRESELPWKDTNKLPYTITGPYLSQLFERAFIDGLHHPGLRPTADEWETALIKTLDLVQPCNNSGCAQKWYVFDNKTNPVCPFCDTKYEGLLPVLNLYSSRDGQSFKPDNHRLMVYRDQSLFPYHINRNIVPNERLADQDKSRVGYFINHHGRWLLVNEKMQDLTDVANKRPVSPGEHIELTDGLQLLCSKEPGGRLFVVQMVNKH
ncbi:helix-hairpin-helix domain-containing protein [Endozoicomonas ascidiicola]|uniref:helix-hairpin-helix domain-containing protein n=1 Tax=Endozoicomonas ascidiicola TaxID=1698521 RepID=UPI00082EBB6A|nr:lipopolysaccharide kinase InaA family protein [Endozoicomonas ascidiicola]USN26994.1 kinase [synthetic construct]